MWVFMFMYIFMNEVSHLNITEKGVWVELAQPERVVTGQAVRVELTESSVSKSPKNNAKRASIESATSKSPKKGVTRASILDLSGSPAPEILSSTSIKKTKKKDNMMIDLTSPL
jgi:hypothetical protein